MKKQLFFLLFITLFLHGFTQSPATINYQGIVRDASGTPVTNTVVNLQFKISTSTNPNFFTETQSAVPVNSLGLFNTKIGSVNPLPANGWQDTPVSLQVFADVNGSGFLSMGTQILASVPYAIYAHQAGNAMPQGTRHNQTMRWDSIVSQWKPSNELTNDGQRVGVGIFPNTLRSKFSSVTANLQDTAAITAIHAAGYNRAAGVRALVFGNTSYTFNPNNTLASAIFGGQHAAYNNGTGIAIGNFGYGASSSMGVGLAGFGYAKSPGGQAIGVYGTANDDGTSTQKYAGFFDNGGVYIKDSLMINPGPGNVGDVLTMIRGNGRAQWMPAGAAGASPWIQQAGFIHQANNSDRLSIGAGTGLPMAKVHIENSAPLRALFINDLGSDHAMQISKSSINGNALKLFSDPTNTVASLDVYHSGSGPGIYSYATAHHALYAINNGSLASAYLSNAGSGPALVATKSTSGIAGYFEINSTSSVSDAVYINSNATAFSIRAQNTNSSPSAYAGFFDGGVALRGKNNLQSDNVLTAKNFSGSDLFSIRNNGVTIVGPGNSPATRLTVEGSDNGTSFQGNSAAPSTGITISNLNNTPNNFSSLNFTGFNGETSKIVGIHKDHSAASGKGDLVFMTRDNTSMNEILRITSAGHLKLTGTNNNSACSAGSSFGVNVFANKSAGSNDIRGEVVAIVTPSAVIPSGASVTITVPFDKPYSSPHVLIQPLDQETAGLSNYISSVNATSFSVVFFNNTQFGQPFSGLKFKYFIVE